MRVLYALEKGSRAKENLAQSQKSEFSTRARYMGNWGNTVIWIFQVYNTSTFGVVLTLCWGGQMQASCSDHFAEYLQVCNHDPELFVTTRFKALIPTTLPWISWAVQTKFNPSTGTVAYHFTRHERHFYTQHWTNNLKEVALLQFYLIYSIHLKF